MCCTAVHDSSCRETCRFLGSMVVQNTLSSRRPARPQSPPPPYHKCQRDAGLSHPRKQHAADYSEPQFIWMLLVCPIFDGPPPLAMKKGICASLLASVLMLSGRTSV